MIKKLNKNMKGVHFFTHSLSKILTNEINFAFKKIYPISLGVHRPWVSSRRQFHVGEKTLIEFSFFAVFLLPFFGLYIFYRVSAGLTTPPYPSLFPFPLLSPFKKFILCLWVYPTNTLHTYHCILYTRDTLQKLTI
jgi:hypothetical protein